MGLNKKCRSYLMNKIIKNRFILLSIIFALLMSFCAAPSSEGFAAVSKQKKVARNTNKNSAYSVASGTKYCSDWMYWNQGASAYWCMAEWGCHVVAYAKLLKETGCPVPQNFNPDTLYNWGRTTKYNDKYYILDNMDESNCAGKGKWPVRYAREACGFNLTFCKRVDFGSRSEKKKADLIMDYLKAGYYVILCCDQHFTYVLRNESLNRGEPVISESWGSVSVNENGIFNFLDYPSYWHKNRPTYTSFFVYGAPAVSANDIANTKVEQPFSYGKAKLGTSESTVGEKVYLNIGQTAALDFFNVYDYNPYTDAGSITWGSSNEKIATVDSNGVVKALKAGNCAIRFTVTAMGSRTIYSGEIMVTVGMNYTPTPTPILPVELFIGLSDGSNTINIVEGDQYNLNDFHVEYVTGNNSSVSWRSVCNDIASVNPDNILTANSAGLCYVTCDAVDNSTGQKFKGSFMVSVSKLTLDIILSRMDTIDEMLRLLFENADYDNNIQPDFTYNTKTELMLKGIADITSLASGIANGSDNRQSLSIAIPNTWSINDLIELMNLDIIKGFIGDEAIEYSSEFESNEDLTRGAADGIIYGVKEGRLKIKTNDDYYFIIVDLS